ncbi:GNAT family N-acetyltransferase [Parvibaculum sp.]|uniref:GNAT family N-acetyltransferase n=1 Tax=Parvibaculum sp. TaxID=2024848 RepID=UPI00329903E2
MSSMMPNLRALVRILERLFFDAGAIMISIAKPLSSSIEGRNLRLRLVESGDAAYLHRLRTDPAYNQYLSTVDGSIQDQQRWIEAYKDREALGGEFYFIIERRDGVPCGTVRLYEIADDRFTWGSWILDSNKLRNAALESALLSFGFGFHHLDLNVARIDVRADNYHAIAFYQRFGMTKIEQSTYEIEFEYTRPQYEEDKPVYLKVLENEASV